MYLRNFILFLFYSWVFLLNSYSDCRHIYVQCFSCGGGVAAAAAAAAAILT